MKYCNRRFIRKNCFTLFELLISVGLLVILSVVLLRTLALTGDYWHKTDEQAQLQADAKTLFSLLSDDLGNLIYAAAAADGGFYAPLHIEDNRLCMVTHNRTQSKINTKEAHSDICKVIYHFVAPVGETAGRVERKCSSDANATASNPGKFDMSATSSSSFYTEELDNSSTVIDTVVKFETAAYKFVKNDETVTTVKVSNSDVFTSSDIRMIHVKLTLLPAKLFKQYSEVSGESEKQEYIRKHGKIFYKAFWIKPINQ